MKKIIVFTVLILLAHFSYAQVLRGTVYQIDEKGKYIPLPSVNILWLGTGIGTVTDINGKFQLEKTDKTSKLIVSFVSYKSDTLDILVNQRKVDVALKMNNELQTFEIINRLPGGFVSLISPTIKYNITEVELHKAACCNLGESFETNASVDVSYSDAVTGAKKIHLLGLAGAYVQMMTDNIYNLYGLSSTYGLGYIPGSWMESIQISKGAASVSEGYTSITGQINTNHKAPELAEKLYLNALGSSWGKYEGNFNSGIIINKNWSTAIFAHAEKNALKMDKNQDGFMDLPLIEQYNFFNRWKYNNRKGYMLQFGLKIIDEKRLSGQMDFDEATDKGSMNSYGIGIDTRRYEGFLKSGYDFKSSKNGAIAFLSGISYHDVTSYYGLRDYDATELSANIRTIYNRDLKNDFHKIKLGASYLYDQYNENLNDSVFTRIESVPGVSAEYTFSKVNYPTIIAGFRTDYHNMYGMLYTPRLHMRYSIKEKNIFRIAGGKGYRTPNLLSENSSALASSRKIIVTEDIEMEEAWNIGINYTRVFKIKKRNAVLNIDAYHTNFVNQLIVDADQSTQAIYFYNLDGKSYSNVYQAEFTWEIIDALDVVVAGRYMDVKTTIHNDFMEKPMVPRYRGMFNVSYAPFLGKWQFDFTANFNGDAALPNLSNNSAAIGYGDRTNAYTLMSAQITKRFKKWNMYLGIENIGNYTQDNPIIDAQNPFGNNFDASIVWAPILGRKIYLGVRYFIER